MTDAESPDESLPFTCTHRVGEAEVHVQLHDRVGAAERPTVPFDAAATAVEALANEESITRG